MVNICYDYLRKYDYLSVQNFYIKKLNANLFEIGNFIIKKASKHNVKSDTILIFLKNLNLSKF